MLWEGSPACARLPSAVAVLWATLGPRAPGLGPWALGVGPWALGLGTLALSGSGRTSLTMLWEGSPACARLPSAVAVLWAAAWALGLRPWAFLVSQFSVLVPAPRGGRHWRCFGRVRLLALGSLRRSPYCGLRLGPWALGLGTPEPSVLGSSVLVAQSSDLVLTPRGGHHW